MRKQISVTRENREFLMRHFAVTQMMVWKALNFESKSDLATRIQKVAIERGGELINTLPVCETIHDSHGRMIQTFENGAQLICEKETGNCSVVYKGKEVVKAEHTSIKELGLIQQEAANLKK